MGGGQLVRFVWEILGNPKLTKAISIFETFVKDIMEESKGYNPNVVKHPCMVKRDGHKEAEKGKDEGVRGERKGEKKF